MIFLKIYIIYQYHFYQKVALSKKNDIIFVIKIVDLNKKKLHYTVLKISFDLFTSFQRVIFLHFKKKKNEHCLSKLPLLLLKTTRGTRLSRRKSGSRTTTRLGDGEWSIDRWTDSPGEREIFRVSYTCIYIYLAFVRCIIAASRRGIINTGRVRFTDYSCAPVNI